MIQETFCEHTSVVHRTQPGLRIILATLYSFTVALMSDLPALAMAVIFSLGLAALARLPVKALFKRLAAAGGFLVLIWLVLPLTHAGPSVGHLGPLAISRSGVTLCLQITCKTMAILTAFSALVATMSVATLGHTLHNLGISAKLVQLLLLAYRYIFVIQQEYRRLLRAAKIRNFQPGTNLHTYRTYAYLVGMLFVHASERARRVHLAMMCRGFKGRFYSLDSFAPTAWNFALGVGVAGMSLLLILKQTLG